MSTVRFGVTSSLSAFFTSEGEKQNMVLREASLPNGEVVICRTREEYECASRYLKNTKIEVRLVTAEEYGSKCQPGDKFFLALVRQDAGKVEIRFFQGVFSPSDAACLRERGLVKGGGYIVFFNLVPRVGPLSREDILKKTELLGAGPEQMMTVMVPGVEESVAKAISDGE